jgi:hypothetical protein
MSRPVLLLALAVSVLLTVAPTPARTAQDYVPPVTHEDRTSVSVWFARVKKTGKWCEFDRQTLNRRSGRDELIGGEFGWARFTGRHLQSVTYARQSEDAYVEDRYYVGSKNEVQKMVRTGHYIAGPWVSVTFEPDGAGHLRLSARSKAVVRKMTADNQETYYVEWNHFSKLSQIPFSRLLKRGSGQTRSMC